MPRIIVNNPRNVIDAHLKTNYFKLKNTGGPKGDKGDKGDTGTAATISAGTASSLPAGSAPTVTNSGTSSAAVFNFGIPKGDKGDKGDTGATGAAATITVGSTTTGAAGTNASVTNSGTSGAAVLNFTIPRGDKGETGATGATGATGQAATIAVGSTTTLAPGANATVTNSGTSSAATFNFGIPQGVKGDTGSVKSTVVSELPESGNSDTFYLVDRDATTGTASGTFITLDNPEPNGEISDYDILGNATQDGTPTPDYPQPISVVTGENVVKIEGKNLLDSENAEFANGYISSSDGSFTSGGGSTASKNMFYLSVGTYTFSNTENRNLQRVCYFSKNKVFVEALTITSGKTFTMPSSGYVRIQINGSTTLQSPQLELGNSASQFEPYQGQEFPIDLGSIELAKIGDYQDRIYKNDGKWYVEKQVGKVVLDGTESGWGTQNDVFCRDFNDARQGKLGAEVLVVSDHFAGRTTCFRGDIGDGECAKITGNNQQVGFRMDSLNLDVDAFKTWLSTHNTTVYYALATPTTTEITNEALIAQLEALLNAELYTGQNNISVTSAANLAGPLDITYAFFDKTNRHKVYIWSDSDNTWQIIVQ